jgi:hypothetical protein
MAHNKSTKWVGKTVAKVLKSPGGQRRCNSLAIVFTDGTSVQFCASQQTLIWATSTPNGQKLRHPEPTAQNNQRTHSQNRSANGGLPPALC